MIKEAQRLSVPYTDMLVVQAPDAHIPQRDPVTDNIITVEIVDENTDILAVEYDSVDGTLVFIKNNGNVIKMDSLPTISKFGTGFTGARGNQGRDGQAGYEGQDAIQGCRGCPGLPGTQGLFGDTGKTGTDGYQGPRGRDGCSGQIGQRGNTGEQGPNGFEGSCGPMGCKGSVNGTAVLGPPGLPADPFVSITTQPLDSVMVWGQVV